MPPHSISPISCTIPTVTRPRRRPSADSTVICPTLSPLAPGNLGMTASYKDVFENVSWCRGNPFFRRQGARTAKVAIRSHSHRRRWLQSAKPERSAGNCPSNRQPSGAERASRRLPEGRARGKAEASNAAYGTRGFHPQGRVSLQSGGHISCQMFKSSAALRGVFEHTQRVAGHRNALSVRADDARMLDGITEPCQHATDRREEQDNSQWGFPVRGSAPVLYGHTPTSPSSSPPKSRSAESA